MNNFKSELIGTADPRWGEILGRADHDFYHLAPYVELEAARIGGNALGCYVHQSDGFIFLPIVQRPLPECLLEAGEVRYDAVTPYGYPGIVSSVSGENGEFWKGAVGRLIEVCAESNICTLFVRNHTILTESVAGMGTRGDLVEHGRTVWVDLSKPDEQLQRETHKTTRNLVRRLTKDGYRARMCECADSLSLFAPIYRETMIRLDADEQYFFNDAYFQGLCDALGGRLYICLVEKNDRIAAAGMFTEICGLVQYHLSGTAGEFRRDSPTRLMLNYVRDWAKRRGNRVFHLGGGLGAKEDGLYRFKKGFAETTSPFTTWRVVCQPEAYKSVCRRWELHTGETMSNQDAFFPPYRKRV